MKEDKRPNELKETEELAQRIAKFTAEVEIFASQCGEINDAIEHVRNDEPIEPPYVRYYYTEGKSRSFVDVRVSRQQMLLSLETHLAATRTYIEQTVEKINELISKLKTIENYEPNQQ